MKFTKFVLQLPLNVQIYISIILIILIVFLFVLILSEEILSINSRYLLLIRKEYFFKMEKEIIESNINFIHLCLIQYEHLIKYFNYQLYLFHEENIKYFSDKNDILIDNNRIKIYNTSKYISMPDYDIKTSEDEQKLYIYCYSNNKTQCNKAKDLIIANYIPSFHQFKGVRNFRIPYYGNFPLMGEYVMSFAKYKTMYSLNNSRIKEAIQLYGENIDDFLRQRSQMNYLPIQDLFDKYSNNSLFFMDLMYKLRYYIFTNYTSLNSQEKKINYVQDQSIYFQTFRYEMETTSFFDSWKYTSSRYNGRNSIIFKYIDFLFFHLSAKVNILSIPITHESNKIISQKLCYFFIFKQIIYLNITLKENDIFNDKFINEIYNTISKKPFLRIEDCKISTYNIYNAQKERKEINVTSKFTDYYNLDYIYEKYFYYLIDNDIDTCIFEYKYSFPDFITLKDFSPIFFSFEQLDFFTFCFGIEISKALTSSREFIKNIGFIMFLSLLYLWYILFFILKFCISSTIKEVTNPIIQLARRIELMNKKEQSKNEEIFEYKCDEDINKFFILCQKLINGEIQDKNINHKNKDNSVNMGINNNIILNNKMILEISENQKELNNHNKEIFMLRHISNDIKKKKIKKVGSLNTKDYESSKYGKIHLKNVNPEMDIKNELLNSSLDSIINNNEKEKSINSLKLYEYLLFLTEYINNRNNNTKKLDGISNKNLLKMNSRNFASNNNKNEIDPNNKYITYYWYINAKKNKLI